MNLPNTNVFQFYEGTDPAHYTDLTGVNLNAAAKALLANDKALKSAVDSKANVSGDNTQTFKVADAVNADEAVSKGQMEASVGKVLQYVYGTLADTQATSNSGFTYTNLAVSITPKKIDSKLLVHISFLSHIESAGNSVEEHDIKVQMNGIDVPNTEESAGYFYALKGNVTQTSTKMFIVQQSDLNPKEFRMYQANHGGNADYVSCTNQVISIMEIE